MKAAKPKIGVITIARKVNGYNNKEILRTPA
jgi:hypothetical protein